MQRLKTAQFEKFSPFSYLGMVVSNTSVEGRTYESIKVVSIKQGKFNLPGAQVDSECERQKALHKEVSHEDRYPQREPAGTSRFSFVGIKVYGRRILVGLGILRKSFERISRFAGAVYSTSGSLLISGQQSFFVYLSPLLAIVACTDISGLQVRANSWYLLLSLSRTKYPGQVAFHFGGREFSGASAY